MDSVARYWNQRYRSEGRIWGIEPLLGVRLVEPILRTLGCRRILVPGCGYGRNALYLAKQEFEVLACDFSEEALKLAREGQGMLTNVEFFWADVRHLDLPNNSVDAVVAEKVLHLMPYADHRAAITEWMRVVRPGGVLCVTAFRDDEPSLAVPSAKEVYPYSEAAWAELWQGMHSLLNAKLNEPVSSRPPLHLLMNCVVVEK